MNLKTSTFLINPKTGRPLKPTRLRFTRRKVSNIIQHCTGITVISFPGGAFCVKGGYRFPEGKPISMGNSAAIPLVACLCALGLLAEDEAASMKAAVLTYRKERERESSVRSAMHYASQCGHKVVPDNE